MSSKQTDTSRPRYHLTVENFGKLAAAEKLMGKDDLTKSFVDLYTRRL